MVEIKDVQGCKRNITLEIDNSRNDIQESLAKGRLQGRCPIVKQDVEFNIGSLTGYPLTAVCENLHCRFHTQLEDIK